MPSFMTFPQRLFVADIPTYKQQTFKVSENMPEFNNITELLSGPPVSETRFFTICDIDNMFFNNRSSMITGFQFRVSANARLYNFPFDLDSTHLFANGLLPAQLVVEIVSTFKEYSSGGSDIFDLIYTYLNEKNAFINNTFVKIAIGLGCLNNNFLNADVINLLGLWVKMEIADSDFSILPLIQARAYFLIPQNV